MACGRTDAGYAETMRTVSKSILDRGVFAGRDFSSADEFIYGTAEGSGGPGNPATWREINTIHHITQVVSDIGRMRGFNIARRVVEEPPRQARLFDSRL